MSAPSAWCPRTVYAGQPNQRELLRSRRSLRQVHVGHSPKGGAQQSNRTHISLPYRYHRRPWTPAVSLRRIRFPWTHTSISPWSRVIQASGTRSGSSFQDVPELMLMTVASLRAAVLDSWVSPLNMNIVSGMRCFHTSNRVSRQVARSVKTENVRSRHGQNGRSGPTHRYESAYTEACRLLRPPHDTVTSFAGRLHS